MKRKKQNLKFLLKYIFITLLFACLTSCIKFDFLPIKLSLLVGVLYNSFPILPTFITYNLTSFLYGNFSFTLIDAGMSSIITVIIFFYSKAGKKPNAELLLYLLATCIPYLVFEEITVKKAVYTSIILVFSFICIVAVKVLFVNGFKYKLELEEIVALSCFSVAVGLGAINLFGHDIWKAFSVFVILFASYLFCDGTSTLTAIILSLPYCLTTRSLNPLGVFAVYSLISLSLVSCSRIFSSFAVLSAELCLYFFTDIYTDFSYVGFVAFVISAFTFTFIPQKNVVALKENFFKFKEKKLTRQAINRARLTLSSKLYEVSGAFDESYRSMGDLKKISLNDDEVKRKVASDIYSSVCKTCPLKPTCNIKNFPPPELLIKLASIGIAKGKLTLMDLPVDFTSNCSFSNNVLYAFNSDISLYRDKLKLSKAFNDERELLGVQAKSIATIIKELATSLSTQLSFSPETEKKLGDFLHKRGVLFSELMFYKNRNDFQIDIVMDREEFENKNVAKILSQAMQKSVHVSSIVNLSSTYSTITFTPSPKYDAIFGISQKCKRGNALCGDCHSLTKIDEGRFMIAVNDGMGSGEVANSVSALTTSMLENFMRTGMDYQFVIKILNKILTVSCPDVFSALDLAIIDLFDGQASFIKVGAPYGYILEKDNIKIVESSSLPLGITEKFSAVAGGTTLTSGDTVVLISDGVSDAFGSSTDLLEYLKTQTTGNPQTLADNILNKAVELDKEVKDDMTVLCVKLFNKSVA